MPHTYQYPRAALTVDCVVFGFDDEELKVLLIERGLEPFKGKWALPGGFVRVGETLDAAARRKLEEEAGLKTSSSNNSTPSARSIAIRANASSTSLTIPSSNSPPTKPKLPPMPPTRAGFHFPKFLNSPSTTAKYSPPASRVLKAKSATNPWASNSCRPNSPSPNSNTSTKPPPETHLDKRNFRKKVLSDGLLIP